MKRLVVLLVVLAIVLIAVAAEMKRNPEGSSEAQLRRLTPAEHVQFEQAKHQFSQAQGRLRQLRDRGGSAAELDAQEKKVEEAAQKVMAFGGTEELRVLGERGRAGHRGGGRSMRGRAGRGGSAGVGRRPGGPAGESTPAEDDAGTSRGR